MSTTTSPAPVTPPPRLGATPHVEEPQQAEGPRWSVYLRWLGDATSIVLLIAVLWWLAYHDGGWERTALAKVGLLAVFAVPAAAAELRRLPTTVRVLIGLWALGLIASLLFAAERSGFAQPTTTYTLIPIVGLSAYRIWRRRWGPPAVAGLLLVSFGLYWYRSFMDWWGLAMWDGRQPLWRPLSWHNQSGTLMVGFGLLFGGVAAAGRRVVALAFGLCAGAAFAGAWLSGSRGTLIVLVVGGLVLTASAVVAKGWRSGASRTLAVVLTSGVIVVGLLGFAEMQTDAEVSRPVSARGESAEDNFLRRFLHMHAAVGMFFDAPITGQGVGSYAKMAVPFTSPDSNLTSSAHNEYAEVLGEGGALLALPFVGLAALGAIGAARRVRRADDGLEQLHGDIGTDDLRWPLSIGATGTIIALLIHQGADFDWAYPVIPSLLGIAMAVAMHDTSGSPRQGQGSRIVPPVVAVVLAGVLIAGSGGTLWETRSHQMQPGLSAQELAHVPVAWDADRASDVAFDLINNGAVDEGRWTLQRAARWNPGYHPVQVDLAIADHAAGAISARELVDTLLSGYLDFASANEVAQALIEGGRPDLARSVLEPLLNLYPRYENWGIDANRADTWYLLVRAALEDGGCPAGGATAASARMSGHLDDDGRSSIQELIGVTCQ